MEATQNLSTEARLEPENFRIDSSGWNATKLGDGTRVKRNPEGDVTELLDGRFKGEQHFTQEAALRETAKAGKRMPTKEEWLAIIKATNPEVVPEKGWQDAIGIADRLGVKLAGYRLISSTGCYGQGAAGNYWSSSSEGPNGCYVEFSISKVNPAALDVRSAGLSVRCLDK